MVLDPSFWAPYSESSILYGPRSSLWPKVFSRRSANLDSSAQPFVSERRSLVGTIFSLRPRRMRSIRLAGIILMLALMSFSQIFSAHASTGNSGGAPFPYFGLGQEKHTVQFLFLFLSCLSVHNAHVLIGELRP